MILGLAAGCSSMRINTDYSEAADFSAFRTFQFKETDDSFAGINQLVHQRIVDTLTQEMKAEGFINAGYQRLLSFEVKGGGFE